LKLLVEHGVFEKPNEKTKRWDDPCKDCDQKMFRLYSVLYPLLWLVSRLDGLMPWASGYMLVARAIRTDEQPPRR
jgi:hypothetical protein